jgi:HPt (histidine-containing phosphotransfer) domain-containing protein
LAEQEVKVMEMQNLNVERVMEGGDANEKIAYVNPELAELIPWFLDNRRKDIESITNLVQAEDFKTLERMGHTLKGTCAGYGFDHLGKIGAKIELAAKARNPAEINSLNEEMKTYLQEVKVVYK